MYVSEDWELLNSVCFNTVRNKGVCLGPKKVGQTHRTVMEYCIATVLQCGLPVMNKVLLTTSIWAKFLEKMARKIPGCQRKNSEPEKNYQLSMTS